MRALPTAGQTSHTETSTGSPRRRCGPWYACHTMSVEQCTLPCLIFELQAPPFTDTAIRSCAN